jgi:hypothetical protein
LRPRQEQSGGADSTNLQAGGNIVHVQVGVTAAEARDIALDVFNANFLTLSGVAKETARDRAERITSEYLEKLQTSNPAALSSVQDPDMLQAIYTAQKGFACSGEEDLERTLVDLLVDRSGQQERDLKTLVLNQAIECLSKLTVGQRKAIAVSFLVRFTRYAGPLFLPVFYRWLADDYVPFIDIASNKWTDYRYAQSTGVGAVTQFTLELEDAFWQRFCGLFTKGFTLDRAQDQLSTRLEDHEIHDYIQDQSVFIPCIRNAEMLQINAVSMDDVKELQAAKGLEPRPGNAGPLETLCLYGRMMKTEIRQDVVAQIPSMARLFDHWNTSGLANFDLTAIGIAIGHAYWRRMTGATAPLEIWL